MTSQELFQRARDVFDAAVALPPAERAAFLDRACTADAELRREVESLISSRERAGASFLTPPTNAVELWKVLPPETLGPAAWAESMVGRRIGRYTLVRLLATGGMGCVFEAQQERPARSVALKLLRPGLSGTSALARFRLEPEVLGRLQHPNIAHVYEAGVHDGPDGPVPFFAMELVAEALTLGEYVSTRELPRRARLELLARVCDAVQHGHQKGVIHRDLKPANILVGADGEPKVIDFGVARATDSDVQMTTMHTHVGDIVGTIRYMSPEQCDGDPAKIDTRSDVVRARRRALRTADRRIAVRVGEHDAVYGDAGDQGISAAQPQRVEPRAARRSGSDRTKGALKAAGAALRLRGGTRPRHPAACKWGTGRSTPARPGGKAGALGNTIAGAGDGGGRRRDGAGSVRRNGLDYKHYG